MRAVRHGHFRVWMHLDDQTIRAGCDAGFRCGCDQVPFAGGNRQVMVCERGIRTFETATRNTLDINAIPLLKGWTHLPVFADPSHGTGKWDLVSATAKGCIAAGADGLIIEVHPHPELALSDGAQSLKPERFAELMADLRRLAPAVGREM